MSAHPPSVPAEPVGQPWWARTPVLLGSGAALLVVSVVFAFAVRAGGDGPSGGSGTETTVVPDGGEPSGSIDERLAAADHYEASWIFMDPNRALPDGSSGRHRPAVWALEDQVVVAGSDNVRAHSLDDGSVRWERAVTSNVCAAVEALPADAEVVVIGVGERCETLWALDADTGEVRWERTWEDFRMGFHLHHAPAGLFVVSDDGIEILDPDDGEIITAVDDEAIARELPPGFRRAVPSESAMAADGSLLVVTVTSYSEQSRETGPMYALGIDAAEGRPSWVTEIAPQHVHDAVPQSRDGLLVLVGDPGEILRLDRADGSIAERYPVADMSGPNRPIYDRYDFIGAAWYRHATAVVDGEPVVPYENVDYPQADGRTFRGEALARHDPATGAERWRLTPEDLLDDMAEIESGYFRMTSGPRLADGSMLVLLSAMVDGRIAVVDPDTGAVRNVATLPPELKDSRILDEPGLFVTDAGLVMAFNPNGGNNSIDEAAETGEDALALVLLQPTTDEG